MAIDQIDHVVDSSQRARSVALGLAVASMRPVVMVVLASLAILVLLPAALAAQAAVGI